MSALEAHQGILVARNRRYTGDGGVDGRITIDGALYLIQVKRYKSAINPAHIVDFAKVVDHDPRAAGGLFVHTGRTGPKSRAAARDHGVVMVSGQRLVDLIHGDLNLAQIAYRAPAEAA